MLIVNLLLLLFCCLFFFFLCASLLSCYLMVNKDEYKKTQPIIQQPTVKDTQSEKDRDWKPKKLQK